MKRFHIHVGVKNLEESINFYSTFFGSKPTKVKDDYAKWMLEDPRINFAISTRSEEGIDHLGIQVDEAAELSTLKAQMKKADFRIFDEGSTTCCYAESEKAWVKDPAGIAWETYHTMNDADVFSEKKKVVAVASACCVPKASTKSSCC